MSIIKDKSIFDINSIPKEIPVRQGLINEICYNLKSSDRYCLLLTGLTGNGKTLSVRKVLENLGKEFAPVFNDCSETSSYTALAKNLIEEVKGKPYREKGKGRYELAEDLKKLMLTKRKKKLVFVFDEIDKLFIKKGEHWDIFFPLLNHGKASFIFISNSYDILGKLDRKIFSRLQVEKLSLEVYSSEDIFKILKQRAEVGLVDGSYDDEILNKIAKFSSEVSGDVRFAIRLFEKTAIATDSFGGEKMSESTLRQAIENTQMSDIDEIFPTLPRHMKIVVVALCMSARMNQGMAITTDAYKTYVFNAQKEQFGAVGERQFRDYLKSLDMLGLFHLKWGSAPSRRGRVRIAIPTFDYLSWLEKNFGNNGYATGW